MRQGYRILVHAFNNAEVGMWIMIVTGNFLPLGIKVIQISEDLAHGRSRLKVLVYRSET